MAICLDQAEAAATAGTTIRCSVGVPAHNEERSIAVVLASLLAQRLPSDVSVRYVVVANGCRDATFDVASGLARACMGEPTPLDHDQLSGWRWTDGARELIIAETPVAGKSRAVNLVHSGWDADIVLLFDSDIHVPPGTVAGMIAAFRSAPDVVAVAPGVHGIVPRVSPGESALASAVRRLLCNAINDFDRTTPRVDGRAYGYRCSIVDAHPPVVAIDAWLESRAFQISRTAYLDNLFILYKLPATLTELVAQYSRYATTEADLYRDYPTARRDIELSRSQARARVETTWAAVGRIWLPTRGGCRAVAQVISERALTRRRKPKFRYRLAGTLFFRWIAHRAKGTYADAKPWETAMTSKW